MAGAALIEAIAKRPEEARSAVVPLSRVACMGLVRLLKGEGVVLLAGSEARFERGLAYYRRPTPSRSGC
jgi:hypothetical protein